MNKKRVRIKDIAVASGISTGTVDRVIHNRGNVTPEVKKRVEQVMKELNYQPNIMASTLANNKVLNIATLLPDFNKDAFWEKPYKGIENALVQNAHFSLNITHYFFEENEVLSFVSQSIKILNDLPDALIVAPIFAQEATHFFKELSNYQLPIILINTHLSITNKTCYIGQDSYQSGVLAARLLSNHQVEGATYLMLHLEVEEKAGNATHIHQKEAGFFAYFKEYGIKAIIYKRAYSETSSNLSLDEFLKKVIDEIPNPKGIFVSTSKTYQLIESIGDKLKHAIIVGFDLLPENIKFLNTGQIDYLINQNPEKQGFLAVTKIVDLLLLKKKVSPIQYLPLDIVVKENVVYYLKLS